MDLPCARVHGQASKRIRLQDLPGPSPAMPVGPVDTVYPNATLMALR